MAAMAGSSGARKDHLEGCGGGLCKAKGHKCLIKR